MKKPVKWNPLKNERLKQIRGLGFEEILKARFIKMRNHPQNPSQTFMIFENKGYIWMVPFVENDHEIFLKTLYPSRKHTKLYKKGLL